MLKIYNSSTQKNSMKACLQSIKEARKTGDVVVICPDRMTLQIEKEIFDILQVSSLFDVNVITMSRLSNNFLKKKGFNKKILTKQLAVTLIKKLIQENELKSFKKVSHHNGFALKLFEMISLFKSNKITPQMLLEQSKNHILKEKLTDLAIIYDAYENYLQNEYTDSFNKLDAFTQLVENEFKNTHIIMVGFDDFTKQAYRIIQMFLIKSKSLSVSTASAYKLDNLNNKNIFMNQIFYSLIELAKNTGVIYDIVEVLNSDDKLHNHIKNNLLSYTPNRYDDDTNQVKIIKFNNKDKELEFVLKNIQYKVIHNKEKYGNFSLAVPNLSASKNEITNKFQEFNIPFYLDASDTLIDSNICKFLFSIFDVLKSNYDKVETLHLLQNYFSGIKRNEIENLELKLNILGISKIDKKVLFEYGNISQFIKAIEGIKTNTNIEIGKYVQAIISTFDKLNISEKTKDKMKVLSDNKDFSLAKNYKIAYEKLVNAMQEISSMFSNYKCSFEEFVEMIKVYIENISITLPPLIHDCVMVYDINTSYVQENKYLYVISCIDKYLPKNTEDVSILSDREIHTFKEELKLSPTVEFMNKKSKFKVFENLLQFSDQLILIYYNSDDGLVLPSSVITSFYAMFENCEVNGDIYILDYSTENEFKQNAFLLNNINKSSAKTNYINLIKSYNINKDNLDYKLAFYSLKEALSNDAISIEENLSHKNVIPNLKTNLFFKSGKTSVSEIESYYRCPYQHFIMYGLRLKEIKTWELKPNDIGNILHSFLDKIIESITYLDDDVTRKNVSNEILSEILKKEFPSALSFKNKHIIRNLYSEAGKIADAMYKQMNQSSFKNMWHEKVFGGLEELSIQYKEYKVYITGKIDRVDSLDNMFSLIDYKTGGDKFKYSDLINGKKLQLFVYVKAVNAISNKLPVLACYMPIKNSFSKDEKEKIKTYQFKGVFSNSIDTLNLLDNTFIENGKNSTIPAKLIKSGDFDQYSKPFAISSEDILKLSEIAFSMVEKAIQKIIDGDISPLPLLTDKSECNNCAYSSICAFNKYHGNKYRIVDDVDYNTLLNKKQDNNENK